MHNVLNTHTVHSYNHSLTYTQDLNRPKDVRKRRKEKKYFLKNENKKISVSLVKRKSKDNKEKWLDSEHFSLGINIVIVLQCNYSLYI